MMRKFTSTILILLHLILIIPIDEVLAAEYRLKATSFSSGKKAKLGNYKLKQVAIGEPFGGTVSNGTYKVKLGYIPAIASGAPQLIANIPDGFLPGEVDLDDYFVDSDGGILTYSVSGNTYIGVSIDPVTHVVTWSVSGFVGSEEIFFTAKNSSGIEAKSNGAILTAIAAPGINNSPAIRL